MVRAWILGKLFLFVFIFIVYTSTSHAAPVGHGPDCEAELTTHGEDLSWLFQHIAARDLEAVTARLPKLKLSRVDWGAALKLLNGIESHYVAKHLTEIPVDSEFRLELALQFSQFDSAEAFRTFSESVHLADLNPDVRFSFARRFHVQKWFTEALDAFHLTAEQRTQLVLLIVGAEDGSSGTLAKEFSEHPKAQLTAFGFKPNRGAARALLGIMTFNPKEARTIFDREGSNSEFVISIINSMTSAEKLEAIALLAKGDAAASLEFTSKLALTPEERENVFIGVAAKAMTATWNFKLPQSMSLEERKHVLLYLLRNVSSEALQASEARDRYMVEALGGVFNFAEISDEVRQILFERDTFNTIRQNSLVGHDSFINLHLFDADGPSLSAMLENFAGKYPSFISTQFVRMFWDKTQDTAIVRSLIRYYLEFLPAREKGPFQENPKWQPKDSLELFSVITGLNYDALRVSRFAQRPVELFAVALDIQESLKRPAFENISVAPEVYLHHRDQFMAFLSTLSDYFSLSGKTKERWSEIVSSLRLSEGITSENLPELTEKVRRLTVEWVRKTLFANGATEQADFTFEQFKQLMTDWGDIEPVMKLISRFSGKAEWRPELPILLEVFKHSLAGTFEDYKYGGPEDAALAPMTAEQRAHWKQNKYALGLAGPTAQIDDTELVESVNQLVKSTLIPHLAAIPGLLSGSAESRLKLKEQFALEFNSLETEVFKNNPHVVMANYIEKLAPAEAVDQAAAKIETLAFLWSEIIENLAHENLNLSDARLWARIALGVLANEPRAQDRQAVTDLRNDLRNLEKLASSHQESVAKSNVVFSVLSSDPKLLLTIGNLVASTSCQDYQTGNVIQALLGYVIDPNVRALASFNLSVANFARVDDFIELVDFVRQKQAHTSNWNGNKRIATFTLANGRVVETLPLPRAFLRQIVKTGKTETADGSARVGILFEKEYYQQHQALDVMRAQHKQIYEQLSRELNAYNKGKMLIHGTRNPGGIYSDSNRNVVTTNYEVTL